MSKTRIMVVDDEPIVGKRLKRLFEKDGYEVEIFTSGSVALEEFKRKPSDIIVTDLKMGRVDGMNILEVVREKNSRTKVIIVTGFGKMETSAEAFRKGAFDFIIKPFKFSHLLQVIKKAEMKLMRDKNTMQP